jgi:hypothetical protein
MFSQKEWERGIIIIALVLMLIGFGVGSCVVAVAT